MYSRNRERCFPDRSSTALHILHNKTAAWSAAFAANQAAVCVHLVALYAFIDPRIKARYCNDRQVLLGFNSLADRYPDIAELWAPNNKRPPKNVLPGSKSPAKWICPDYGGEYTALIADVVAGEANCPYCNDRQVLPGFNSFAVRHDDLLQEWDVVNNYLIADTDQIGDRCQTSVWRICSKDPTHEYMMPPARRLLFQKRHRESCLYCKGLRRKKRHFV